MRGVELGVGGFFHHVDGELAVDFAGAEAGEAGDDGVGGVCAEDHAGVEVVASCGGEGDVGGVCGHAGYGCAEDGLG